MSSRKRTKAVALGYDPELDDAPKVLAKGHGRTAEKIIELAKRHGIPLKEEPQLVELLCMLELEEHIPPELYQAVAEILAFVYRINPQRSSAVFEDVQGEE